MNRLVLFFTFVSLTAQSLATCIQGGAGSLRYLDGIDGDYRSLVYKAEQGDIRRIFDEGLRFNYDSRIDSGNLSPDKAYSVVHFSESGTLNGDDDIQSTHTMYLCAFVRMRDGCVVSVAEGQQCDGEWKGGGQWTSVFNGGSRYLLEDPPTADKVYKGYALGRMDLTQASSPRVLSYLAEGTTFENLLACDPPRESNKNAYSDLLNLLQRDGDINNHDLLKKAMSNAGNLLKAPSSK